MAVPASPAVPAGITKTIIAAGTVGLSGAASAWGLRSILNYRNRVKVRDEKSDRNW